MAWLWHRVDPAVALERLQDAPLWAFVLPVLLLLGNALLQAWRIRLLLQAGGVNVGWARVASVVLQALFVSQILPRGSADLLRVAWLGKETGQPSAVLAALMTARFFELLTWMSLLFYGLAWGVGTLLPWVGASAAVFAAGFAALTGGALLAARFGDRVVARLPGAPLRRQAASFAQALRKMGGDRRRLALAALLTLPLSAGNVLAAWVVLEGHDLSLSAAQAFAIIPSMDTLIMLPITVSGVGLREGVFVYAMGRMGVDEPTAVAMALNRWSGELGRAAVGGVFFLLGARLRAHRGPSPRPPG